MKCNSEVRYTKLIAQCNACIWIIKEYNLNYEIFNDYLISFLSYPKNILKNLDHCLTLKLISNDHFWN